jgi:conjugal transfer pilus assembly protein TraB
VYAPTEGAVLPVQIRLDSAVVGPNRARIPLREAFVIGKATGDANSQRVVIQLDKIAFVTAEGRSAEAGVNGYVADDDGVQGLAGRFVWRLEEAAGIAALAGGVSAAAEAAAQGETTTGVTPLGGLTQTVTGDLGRFAAARGASRAAGEIEKLVARRLEAVVPAIYVPNGRKLTICLIDGVTLEGLSTYEVSDAVRANPYAGLDLDR